MAIGVYYVAFHSFDVGKNCPPLNREYFFRISLWRVLKEQNKFDQRATMLTERAQSFHETFNAAKIAPTAQRYLAE